jgi:hypothetical protein
LLHKSSITGAEIISDAICERMFDATDSEPVKEAGSF